MCQEFLVEGRTVYNKEIPIIEGKISYVVPFTEKHLNNPKYIAWLRDYEVIKTLNLLLYIEKPVSYSELKEYYKNLCHSNNDIFFALISNESDEFIGTVRVSQIDKKLLSADVGIMIGEKEYWGSGISTDILKVVCNYLFSKLEMRKLTCGFMAVNPAMQRVFEKLGFKVEGIFRKRDFYEGKFVDHIYMGCFIDEFIDNKYEDSLK